MIMYKEFRVDKQMRLHPLFVNPDEIIQIGVWLQAQEGQRTVNGRVKSKLGELAFRPGWHLSRMPYAPHIGIKENGVIKYMHPDTVWCECEVHEGHDYTPEARRAGMKNGKLNPRNAYLKELPKGGFYWYNTNPNAYGDWMIADLIMVNRMLTDEETARICWTKFGIHAQLRMPNAA